MWKQNTNTAVLDSDTSVIVNDYLTLINQPVPSVPKYRAFSTFSGGGGLDLGAELAGYQLVWATDIAQANCETLRYNFPKSVIVESDVKDISASEICSDLRNDTIDVLLGGPPCQAFSILGKRDSLSDPRGQLVYEYLRLIKELRPKAFIFENVPGLLTVNGGRDWGELLLEFESTGYTIHKQVLNSADYGIPQIRKRIFVVGLSQDVRFDFPTPTHRDPETLDLLGHDLPVWRPAKLALESVANLPNHRIRVHGDRVYNRYRLIPPGERDRVDHTDRIHPDKPSGTVLVGSSAGGGRPHIHPVEHRHITVREAARLQSFPDWYVFRGTETWQYRQVGNAVPPLLAKLVLQSVGRSIELMR